MADAAQNIYPGGPKQTLGNQDKSVVTMPSEVFKKQDWNRYEDIVDEHIKKYKLQEGDQFRVDHPNGPRFYEYLGPDSGGRRDWHEIQPADPKLTS